MSSTTDSSPPRFCRHCSYDLRASSEKCPECGQPFDPADPKSFRRSARQVLKHYVTLITAFGFFALIAYVSLYLLSVQQVPSGGMIFSGAYSIDASGNVLRLDSAGNWDHYNILPKPFGEQYAFLEGSFSHFIFRPANALDRAIRTEHWLDYGHPAPLVQGFKAFNKLHLIGNKEDFDFLSAFESAADRMWAYAPWSPQYLQAPAKATEAGDKLIARLRQREAERR